MFAMELGSKEMIEALRSRLEQPARSGESAGYVRRMWDYVLAAQEQGADPVPSAKCDAIPYVPFDPESLGLELRDDSAVLDIGCLGGYGLYDFVCRRSRRGKALPRLTGVDLDGTSVGIGTALAGVWAQGLTVEFRQGRAEELPFGAGAFDLAIARLLLPYARIGAVLAGIAYILKPGGIALFQLHAFRYYLDRFLGRGERFSARAYYLRALASGALFALTGCQPRHPWLAETALGRAGLTRLCARHKLESVWNGGFEAKPLIAFRRA